MFNTIDEKEIKRPFKVFLAIGSSLIAFDSLAGANFIPYDIRKGDTLSEIAFKFDPRSGDSRDYKEVMELILKANPSISDPHLIHTHAVIKIPQGRTFEELKSVVENEPINPLREDMIIYKVTKGDTLSKVSKKFYGDYESYKEILIDNPSIQNAELIFPSMKLVIRRKGRRDVLKLKEHTFSKVGKKSLKEFKKEIDHKISDHVKDNKYLFNDSSNYESFASQRESAPIPKETPKSYTDSKDILANIKDLKNALEGAKSEVSEYQGRKVANVVDSKKLVEIDRELTPDFLGLEKDSVFRIGWSPYFFNLAGTDKSDQVETNFAGNSAHRLSLSFRRKLRPLMFADLYYERSFVSFLPPQKGSGVAEESAQKSDYGLRFGHSLTNKFRYQVSGGVNQQLVYTFSENTNRYIFNSASHPEVTVKGILNFYQGRNLLLEGYLEVTKLFSSLSDEVETEGGFGQGVGLNIKYNGRLNLGGSIYYNRQSNDTRTYESKEERLGVLIFHNLDF